jgi:hypothetical protein
VVGMSGRRRKALMWRGSDMGFNVAHIKVRRD